MTTDKRYYNTSGKLYVSYDELRHSLDALGQIEPKPEHEQTFYVKDILDSLKGDMHNLSTKGYNAKEIAALFRQHGLRVSQKEVRELLDVGKNVKAKKRSVEKKAQTQLAFDKD